jgi:hypothetical protein
MAVFLSAGWPSYFFKVRKVYKNYHLSIPWRTISKLYIATIIAGIPTFISSYLIFDNLLKLIIGALIEVSLYTITVLAINGITPADIEILKELTKGTWIIGVLLEKLLNFANKIYLLLHSRAVLKF